MSSIVDFFRITLLPALCALVLYYTTTTHIIPFCRSNRAKYAELAQYLPIHMRPTNTSTSGDPATDGGVSGPSLRTRIGDALVAFILPRHAHARGQRAYSAEREHDGEISDSEHDLEGGIRVYAISDSDNDDDDGNDDGNDDDNDHNDNGHSGRSGLRSSYGRRARGSSPMAAHRLYGNTLVPEHVGRNMFGFQGMGVLTAARREEMVRETREMEGAVGSVRRS